MPTYIDIHEIKGGVTADDVAKAHAHDVKVEGKYGVHYYKYWVMRKRVKSFAFAKHQALKQRCKSIAKRMAWWPIKLFKLRLTSLTCLWVAAR